MGTKKTFRLWKRKDHLSGEILYTTWFIPLQGKYSSGIARLDKKQRLENIRAGRKSRYKPVPWGNSSTPLAGLNRSLWVDPHFVFFARLEGMSVEYLGNDQFALYKGDQENVCVTNRDQIEICGSDDTYQALKEISQKWTDLGTPSMTQYLVEVWPLDVPKRKPKNGWLVQRQHTQLIFRLKNEYSR